jgi:hypothetical protein
MSEKDRYTLFFPMTQENWKTMRESRLFTREMEENSRENFYFSREEGKISRDVSGKSGTMSEKSQEIIFK